MPLNMFTQSARPNLPKLQVPPHPLDRPMAEPVRDTPGLRDAVDQHAGHAEQRINAVQ